MKKFILALVLFAVANTAVAQGTPANQKQTSRRGEVAGYTSRDATVLSMMGWGVALAVGIATLCSLIEKNPASGSSSTSH